MSFSADPAAWVARIRAGDRRALARALTHIENDTAPALLAALYPHTGQAHYIGVTGAPGTGKSSLVNALALHLRRAGQTIAILAVDPSSPFTRGAVLGDRIRMRDLSGDPGVFIRSMATRGSLGGLAPTTLDLARALDAAGFDVVILETVGAGQSEVAIAGAAHTTLVVEAPGLGDDIQANKAGILEIADILVVNKADLPAARGAVAALRGMLDLGHRMRPAGGNGPLLGVPGDAIPDDWVPPIVETVALQGEGIPALAEALAAHRDYLRAGD
ncbi:MAG: methylmalonyl Co-A mutase-associated GTPase MeaB, partial [Anaerolineales bacterium]